MRQPFWGAAAGLSMAAGLLWGQQTAVPAPPRPPTTPFTSAELEAIPLVPPRHGTSVTKTLFDGKTLCFFGDGAPKKWPCGQLKQRALVV
jgi:hypothetical protein